MLHLDYFIHAANILLLAAYSVRDILWLRLFAVASSLIAMPYFLFQPTPLWAAFGWSVLFAGINIFQSWRLYLERRPVRLTLEEEEVRRLAFPGLPPRKVLQILSIGTWRTVNLGERLIEYGKPVESLYLIVRGKVQVTKDGQVLGELGAGEVVGSALLLTGASSTVEAVTVELSTRIVRWEAGTLERYLNANPETRNVFQRHLARDLAGKVHRLGTDLLNSAPSVNSAPSPTASPRATSARP
jgi:CRP-like cAMP-binding protein